MNDQVLINYLRHLNDTLSGAPTVDDEAIDALEEIQANLAAIYSEYENNSAPVGAETLRELMMEALHLIHQGVEEFLLFADDFDPARLATGLSMAEEGNDVLSSIRYSIQQDQSWTSSAAVH